jgi:hypothetical protein
MPRALALLVLLLLTASPAWAAITFNTASSGIDATLGRWL